jgi:hypothetical protein
VLEVFGNLFRRKSPAVFDIEKSVGRYLLQLPRCSSSILVVSPRYAEQHYRCEIVLDVELIVEWAEHHANAAWSSCQEEQAGRMALPIWLRGFDSSNLIPSEIPSAFSHVLRPYILDFIRNDIAAVTCVDCGYIVNDIAMTRKNDRRVLTWSWWTDEWHCPAGHLLYREDHELHLHLRSA